jgi:hypothetical protein
VALVAHGGGPDASGVIYLVGVLGVSSICGLGGLATTPASACFNFLLPPFTAHAGDQLVRRLWRCPSSDVFAQPRYPASNLASRARRERRAARRARRPVSTSRSGNADRRPGRLAAVLPTLASQALGPAAPADGVIHRGSPFAAGCAALSVAAHSTGRSVGELLFRSDPPGADDPAAASIGRSLA